mmetsp:Transcript_15487/g.23061  ORF Transcript_15487/g.23061 Transcript_15487/m.23061 type:complete len:390 (-) Transcript_15487:184-1353(-)|eukprot:CAMPEP_0171460974 /NCGR_PEP_ID=MMETSP0945-20130129/5622_1 /TAXON_ID=109269 /ORGANISM="Vaucheria litorea, Strain CCMP2940" /LENGTH=389 /DNA_ID=CAMNT_0011987257 /DNA_START=96 /DNA_END=1265 /DNA_ORIENTATION=-
MSIVSAVKFESIPLSVIDDLIAIMLEPKELSALALTCRTLSDLSRYETYWKQFIRSRIATPRVQQFPTFELCRSVVKALKSSHRSVESSNLIKTIASFSSCDQEEESPQNTLVPSKCFTEFDLKTNSLLSGSSKNPTVPLPVVYRYAQMLCGCSGMKPCYWSSRGSSKGEEVKEYLSYFLRDGVNIVDKFSVMPYRAYWQPFEPTYAPANIRLSFYHPCFGPTPYFSSETFLVENDMKLQMFSLRKPALFLSGGEARVELFGMQQKQQLGPVIPEQFYTCISYVGIYGASLEKKLSFDPVSMKIGRFIPVQIRSEEENSWTFHYVSDSSKFKELYLSFKSHYGTLNDVEVIFYDKSSGRKIGSEETPLEIGCGMSERIDLVASIDVQTP